MKRFSRIAWLLVALLALSLVTAACTRNLLPDEQSTATPDTSIQPPPVDPGATDGQGDGQTPTDGGQSPTDGEVTDPGDSGTTDGGTTDDGGTTTDDGSTTTDDGGTATDGGDTTGDGTATDPPPPLEDGKYIVQSGDTLGQIAERFGVTTAGLAAANGITNINSLSVGQELTIPEPGADDGTTGGTSSEEQTYIVQRGDTLFRIGLAYGYTVEELVAYNGLSDANSLDVGQEIRIPPSE